MSNVYKFFDQRDVSAKCKIDNCGKIYSQKNNKATTSLRTIKVNQMIKIKINQMIKAI